MKPRFSRPSGFFEIVGACSGKRLLKNPDRNRQSFELQRV
jgi:hypothetical protein